jgi:hypothetical protein
MINAKKLSNIEVARKSIFTSELLIHSIKPISKDCMKSKKALRLGFLQSKDNRAKNTIIRGPKSLLAEESDI